MCQFDTSSPPYTLQAYDSIKDSGQKPYGFHNRQHLKMGAVLIPGICPFCIRVNPSKKWPLMSIVETKSCSYRPLSLMVLLCIDNRVYISRFLLSPPPVTEYLDVPCYLPDRPFSCCVTPVVNKLVLHGTPEALGRRIVMAVAFSAHGCLHREHIGKVPVSRGTVLASPAGVVEKTGQEPFPLYRHQ